MRIMWRLFFGALGCALLAAVTVAAASPPSATDLMWQRRVPRPPLVSDGDRDGFPLAVDCNDDDVSAHPFLEELDNGIDDNCDGVIDEGFDTTIDWPAVAAAKVIWPDNKALRPDELISMDATPRVVWTGNFLAAVWGDRGNRIRLARFDRQGKLLDDRPLVLRKAARNPDVAWTGTRFGIVYEDVSTILPAIWLMTVDEAGTMIQDAEIASNATEPQIAWGRDRFGVAWRDGSCVYDCVNFARFGRDGKSLDKPERLEFSGGRAAIAYSGSSVAAEMGVLGDSDSRDGAFGIAYEGSYAFRATADVRLAIRPRDIGAAGDSYPIGSGKPGETILVNERNHQCSCWGTMPSIAAGPTGFMLCWHELKDSKQHGAAARFVSLDGTMPIPELTPDLDAGRASRLTWTGNEYAAVNDNLTDGSSEIFQVHFRRLDPSANSHGAAGWGPWREVTFDDLAPGKGSSNPDVTNTGATLGVIWLEMDDRDATAGRIWFASVAHQ